MKETSMPQGPVPEPLRGAETGTFAHYTITVRFANILRQVLKENSFLPAAVQKLEAILRSIPDAPLEPLVDPNAPDTVAWNHYLEPYLGQNWLEAPWFVVETYFYRRILQESGYFQPGPGQGLDPYARQKRQSLEQSVPTFQVIARKLHDWLQARCRNPEALASLLLMDLWGNQADLSMWPSGGKAGPNHRREDQQREHLLVDNTPEIIAILKKNPRRLDVLADNAGMELFQDLALVDYLLGCGFLQEIHLHFKSYPTFVSDATIEDVQVTVRFLADQKDENVGELGRRLDAHLRTGRLSLRADLFWTSPLSAWEMPPHLRQDLESSDLTISKGDANYRRLLGDRHWSFDTPFKDILRYFPSPMAALRVLKSEVAAGLQRTQIQWLQENDPHWLVNGKWGVIQGFHLG